MHIDIIPSVLHNFKPDVKTIKSINMTLEISNENISSRSIFSVSAKYHHTCKDAIVEDNILRTPVFIKLEINGKLIFTGAMILKYKCIIINNSLVFTRRAGEFVSNIKSVYDTDKLRVDITTSKAEANMWAFLLDWSGGHQGSESEFYVFECLENTDNDKKAIGVINSVELLEKTFCLMDDYLKESVGVRTVCLDIMKKYYEGNLTALCQSELKGIPNNPLLSYLEFEYTIIDTYNPYNINGNEFLTQIGDDEHAIIESSYFKPPNVENNVLCVPMGGIKITYSKRQPQPNEMIPLIKYNIKHVIEMYIRQSNFYFIHYKLKSLISIPALALSNFREILEKNLTFSISSKVPGVKREIKSMMPYFNRIFAFQKIRKLENIQKKNNDANFAEYKVDRISRYFTHVGFDDIIILNNEKLKSILIDIIFNSEAHEILYKKVIVDNNEYIMLGNYEYIMCKLSIKLAYLLTDPVSPIDHRSPIFLDLILDEKFYGINSNYEHCIMDKILYLGDEKLLQLLIANNASIELY